MKTAEYIAVQIVTWGPLLGLVGIAIARTRDRATHPVNRAARLFMLSVPAPMLAAFLVASVRSRIGANWAVPAYATLLVFAAQLVWIQARACRSRALTVWWRGTLAFMACSVLAIHAPMAMARLPLVGQYVPVHRFVGFRAFGQFVGPSVEAFRRKAGGDVLLIAESHNDAGPLAFYLPGRPLVASAGRFLGYRQSPYDFFPDTDLGALAHQGRPAVFVGGSEQLWRSTFALDDLSSVGSGTQLFTTRAFRGPRRPGP